MLFSLIILVAKMAFWAFLCWKVIEDKGYDSDECRKYAILGAIFGLIVLIVAICKEKKMDFGFDYEDTYVAKLAKDNSKSTSFYDEF